MCGDCCECTADGLCGQKLVADSPQKLTAASKKSCTIIGIIGIIAHVVGFFGGELPFYIANWEGWISTGGIGFIVPIVTTVTMVTGLVGAVLLTAGDSVSSYQLTAIASTTAGMIHAVILVFELLGFVFSAMFGGGGDVILWLLLIKNILCVSTEGAAMICAQNAGGALKTARLAAQQQQGVRSNQVVPSAGVPLQVATGTAVTVPIAVPVAVPAHVP